MAYLGADFSSVQGPLPETGLESLSFGYVKATQGSGYKNPDAPQQVSALRKQGVRVGLYHYVTLDDLYDQQMSFYMFAKNLGGSQLPPALDIETGGPGNWAALSRMVANFALSIEGWTNAVVNRRSILYANLDYYDNLPNFPYGRWVWLANPGVAAPQRPCVVWQNGENTLPGVPGQVDVDVFTGTEAEWQLFIGTDPPPQPQEEEDMPLIITSAAPGQPTYLVGTCEEAPFLWKKSLPEPADVAGWRAAGAVTPAEPLSEAFLNSIPGA